MADDAAQAALAGLALVDIGVKKLREAGLIELADGLERTIVNAVQEAADAFNARVT